MCKILSYFYVDIIPDFFNKCVYLSVYAQMYTSALDALFVKHTRMNFYIHTFSVSLSHIYILRFLMEICLACITRISAF